MKNSRIVAFILIGLAVLFTSFGGVLDMVGASATSSSCGCSCPMCKAGRCAKSLYGGPCSCMRHDGAGTGLYVSKAHLWNDGLFLMLLAIIILIAF